MVLLIDELKKVLNYNNSLTEFTMIKGCSSRISSSPTCWTGCAGISNGLLIIGPYWAEFTFTSCSIWVGMEIASTTF